MIELQLPTYVSEGAVEVDSWETQTNILPSGRQQRIRHRSKALSKMTISYSTIDETKHIALRDFKLAVGGSFLAFRAKFWGDYKSDLDAPGQSCSPATGTGVLTTFQLQKTYTIANPGTSYVRTITKPVNSTVAVYVNSVLKTETTDYTINYATGVVTFLVAPTNGHTVKATFEFDKPCHFVSDENGFTIEQDAGDLSVFHHDTMELEEVDEI